MKSSQTDDRRRKINSLKDRLSIVSEELVKLKFKSRRDYFMNKFNQATDSRSKWDTLNNLLGNSKQKKTITKIRAKNKTFNNPKNIANEFNQHFCSIGR